MEVESGESLVLSHPHHLYFPTDFTLPNFFINKQLKHAKFNLKIKNNEYLLERFNNTHSIKKNSIVEEVN